METCCPRQTNRKTPLPVVWVWGGMLAATSAVLLIWASSARATTLGSSVSECLREDFKASQIKETYKSGQVGRQISMGTREGRGLRQRESQAASCPDLPQEWQPAGCLGPRPWLFGAVRTRSRAPLEAGGSRVLSLSTAAYRSLGSSCRVR